jgi:hypothetical protein
MSAREYVLAETQLEERDGALWVSGRCPPCWERFAFRVPARGRSTGEHVRCPNGHLLRIAEQTSAGGSHARANH